MIQALLADLLPWVIAFYLVDGIVQLGRGHLLLAGTGRLRPLRAGLHWVGPSPLTEAVAVFDLPWLRGGGRMHLLDPRRRGEPAVIEPADLTAVDLAALGPLAREARAVTAGGKKLLSAPTAAIAAQLLASLRADGAGEMAGGSVRTDLRAARALRRLQRPYRLALRALASASAADLIAAGLAVWSPLSDRFPAPAIAAALVGSLAATAAVGVAYLRSAGEGWGASLSGGLSMLLPWAGLHPLVHLSRSLFRRFDALTAAAALLPPERFQALAARELMRARLSRARTAPELRAAWDEREQRIVRLLAGTGSSAEAALAPPAPSDGAAAYCPLCRARYRGGFDRCADCGVALEPLRPQGPDGAARLM